MDINAWLRSPSSHMVISGIPCLQGGGGEGGEGSLRRWYCKNWA